MKYYSSFSSIIFTFLLLFLSLLSSVSSDILHDSCRKAAKSDANLSYHFCVSTLEANPKSKNDASLEDLVAISLELTISKAATISSHITRLLKDKSFNLHTKSVLVDCFDLYSDSTSSLKDAMNDLINRTKDYQSANIKVSSATDASGTCEVGFKEKKGEICPLTKENDSFFQSTAIVLAFINMLQ